MALKAEMDVEVKSSADEFFQALLDSTVLFPKIFPEQYKDINVVEGNGKSVGSVRIVNYAEGVPYVKVAKEKVEVYDLENKIVSYSVIEGEILSYFNPFKCTLQVVPQGEGSLVKWCFEYDKVTDEGPTIVREMAVRIFSGVDAYLLGN